MYIQIKYCKLKSPNIAYPSITAPKLLTLFENDQYTCTRALFNCDGMETCFSNKSTCCDNKSTCCDNKSTSCDDLCLQKQLNDVIIILIYKSCFLVDWLCEQVHLLCEQVDLCRVVLGMVCHDKSICCLNKSNCSSRPHSFVQYSNFTYNFG